MKKILNSLLVSGMILGGAHQGLSAQTQNKTKTPQGKNIQYKQTMQKKLTKILTMDHDTIIKQSFSSILQEYGMKAGTDTIRHHILVEINNERAKVGASPLKLDSSLQIAAKNQAEFLFNHRDEYINDKQEIVQDPHFQWFHDGTYNSITERLINVGYGVDGTENIFLGKKPVGESQEKRKRGNKNINNVVRNGWMISINHKKNMLNTEYQGIGIYIVGDIVVVVFGKPELVKRKWTTTKT